MQANKYEGYEIVKCLGVEYLFKADFRFLAELNTLAGMDPMKVHEGLLEGHCDPHLILAVMQAAFQGEQAREECEKLITIAGLDDCLLLCRHLLLYAMVGSEKKQHLQRREMTQKIINTYLRNSPWQILKHHVLLWAYLAVIFGVYVCISFKIYELLT